MVEKVSEARRVWLERHSKEVAVRRSLGQTYTEIGKVLGWSTAVIGTRARRHGLNRALTAQQRGALIGEIVADKALEALLVAEPGSQMQARLQASLDAVTAKMSDGQHKQESDVRTRKAIGEMSDDELRAYVASLVPGLEIKSATGDDTGRAGMVRGVSVPEDGETGSETAKRGDELA